MESIEVQLDIVEVRLRLLALQDDMRQLSIFLFLLEQRVVLERKLALIDDDKHEESYENA